jgi:hypothetical protein
MLGPGCIGNKGYIGGQWQFQGYIQFLGGYIATQKNANKSTNVMEANQLIKKLGISERRHVKQENHLDAGQQNSCRAHPPVFRNAPVVAAFSSAFSHHSSTHRGLFFLKKESGCERRSDVLAPVAPGSWGGALGKFMSHICGVTVTLSPQNSDEHSPASLASLSQHNQDTFVPNAKAGNAGPKQQRQVAKM